MRASRNLRRPKKRFLLRGCPPLAVDGVEGEEEEADEDMEVSDVEATSIDRLFLYMVLTYIMCRSAHIFIPVLSCTAKVGALCQVASTKPGPPTPRVCHIPRFPVACCIYVFDFFI